MHAPNLHLFDVCPGEEVDDPGEHLPSVLQVAVEDAGDLLLEVHQAWELIDRVPKVIISCSV